MTKKIVLDVDGVLLNFIEAFEQVALSMEKELGTKIVIDPLKYSLQERLSINLEQENMVWAKFNKDGYWEKLNPLPGVIEAIDAINGAGFEIYIVTAIEEAFKDQRLLNLTKIGVSPKQIHCVGYGQDKGKFIKEIDPDVFVDDRLEHLHRAAVAYHLVWLQDDVSQHNLEEDRGVDVSVRSLKEWVDNHMPQVIKELDESAQQNIPLQRKLRFI